MRFNLSLFFLALLPFASAAQTDTGASSFKRFGISVQGGPPVRILSTEFIDEDSPGLVPIGSLKRYAYSVGGTFRYYFNPELSAYARFAIVRRDFLASDTVYTVIAETNDGTVHNLSATAQYTYVDYTVRNVLAGLGMSYEVPVNKLRIQVSAELAYVKYLQIHYNTGSRSHIIVDNDSLNNSNDYSSHRINRSYTNETFPNVSSAGMLIQTGMEYRFCPRFGVSAAMLFGAFYTWAKNDTFGKTEGNTSDFSDSNGVVTHTGSETVNISGYTRRQFDFSPPTGLLGLNFYF